jgi:tripartite-type tricarboxylate transporter receptor subunit TctC
MRHSRKAAGMGSLQHGSSRLSTFLFGSLSLLLAATGVQAQQKYPIKPIRLIVPFVPGSPIDATVRALTQHLQARLGQSVVIENRPGAGTTIGTKAAAAATPDGYTLLFAGASLAYYSTLYPSLAFDPLKSLTPVATAVTWSHVMVVTTSVPARTIAELIAYAKANPGKIVFGFGLGTTPHVLGETFRQAAGGIDINFVPYRGGEQARADLLGGRVHLNMAPVGTLLPLIQDGKVRPLAYTGPKRSPHLPEVPTMTESGFPQVGFNPDGWQGFLGPAGMAGSIVNKLNTEVNESMKSPEVNAVLRKLAFEPKVTTPQEFSAFLTAQMQKMPPILRAAGVKPE